MLQGGASSRHLHQVLGVPWGWQVVRGLSRGLAFRLRKGDRVKLTGYFQERSYKKDGETKSVRQFVVLNLEPLKLKVREEIA